MAVKFTDNSVEVKAAISNGIEGALTASAGEIMSAAQRNTRVDTGQTKNSFQYAVEVGEGQAMAAVGSNYQNAIWEEFGTGEYSIKGGRQGGWRYKDAKGNWHFTRGKTPTRALFNAFSSCAAKVEAYLKSALGGL